MKLLFSFLIMAGSFACNCSKKTQKATAAAEPAPAPVAEASVSEKSMFPVGVFFGSMASGPADDTFLKEWISSYAKENKVTINGDVYRGCGKEGEYIIVLKTDGAGIKKPEDFKNRLEDLIKKQAAVNKKSNPSAGPISVQYNVTADQYEYCRLGSKKWL
ncbi:MAG: hypothetical protein QM687_12685 [Ferruginibacter sp.]